MGALAGIVWMRWGPRLRARRRAGGRGCTPRIGACPDSHVQSLADGVVVKPVVNPAESNVQVAASRRGKERGCLRRRGGGGGGDDTTNRTPHWSEVLRHAYIQSARPSSDQAADLKGNQCS